MGRPSKLAPDVWAAIERRLVSGEGVRGLAREYRIDPAAISRRFPQQTQHVRDLARRLADVHTDVAALPASQQHLVVQLADELRSISRHLAAAARLGSQTAVVLAAKAREQVATVNDEASLRAVAMMTRIANEAAETGLALLRSNEHAVHEVEAERRRDAQRVTRIEIVPMQPRESPKA
jgi:sugar phosphate isomerase/epimerase